MVSCHLPTFRDRLLYKLLPAPGDSTASRATHGRSNWIKYLEDVMQLCMG